MKSWTKAFVLSALIISQTAHADMFGGDVAVLVQILANALQELAELKQMLQNGQDSLQLMRDINRGINDSLALARTISPNSDPGLFKEWQSIQGALNGVEGVYGIASPSIDQQVYQDTDQSVAEAVQLNNSIYNYTAQVDEIGEAVKEASHSVSPGGAQKLTAETLGVMLHVMNQNLRTQATGLKLQAQAMAVQNKKDKDSTREYLSNAQVLKTAMKNEDINFQVPRF
jgi:Asp-tRNA(Asn)/Glu-tRNA(Gln) amidotransferase C subunit